MPRDLRTGPLNTFHSFRTACQALGAVVTLSVTLAAQTEAEELDLAQLGMPAVLESHCYDCHWDGSDKGGFQLDELIRSGTGVEQRGQWLKVWRNVRNEFMPPDDDYPLDVEQRREVARWIEQYVFAVDPEHIDPGVVTIRRLNREEYQHTINDLFGTDFDLKDRLLPDDSAHGFDNIGDAQTLSPALFDRYLDLAEWIVDEVVVTGGPPLPRLLHADLTRAPGTADVGDEMVELDNGGFERLLTFAAPQAGRFRVEMAVKIGGWQDHTGDAQLKVVVNDQVLDERKLPIAGSLDEVYTYEFDASAGQHQMTIRADLLPPPPPSLAPKPVAAEPETPEIATSDPAVEEARRLAEEERQRERAERRAERRAEMQRILAENFPEELNEEPGSRPPAEPPKLRFGRLDVSVTGPLDGSIVGEYPAAHQRVFFAGAAPQTEAGRRAYAREILSGFASRAFRRPIDDKTLTGLVEIAANEADFETGVGTALTAVLVSPRFLYREELQPEPDNPRESFPLDEYALASRLSYLLWLSIPDETLTARAAAGTLRANLDSEIVRMLADPKSERFFRDFTGQWLRTRNVLMTAITPGNIADRLEPVREDMKAETDMLFEYIAREDRDLLELVTANYSFLNEALANWYGVEGVTGDELRRVDLPPESHRGGVLTHGSILVSTSNPNRTSPVKRGVFVLENILGTPPPPPPAAVPALEEAQTEGIELLTLRDQLAAHRADRACASCHAHFDPIGLALENFSYLGRWRNTDNGVPIDASGEMVTGETFATFDELRALIAARKDKFYRCVTEKLMTYALGRGLEPHDAPTVDTITDRLISEGGSFSTLLMSVVESPAFQRRRGAGERVGVAGASHAGH